MLYCEVDLLQDRKREFTAVKSRGTAGHCSTGDWTHVHQIEWGCFDWNGNHFGCSGGCGVNTISWIQTAMKHWCYLLPYSASSYCWECDWHSFAAGVTEIVKRLRHDQNPQYVCSIHNWFVIRFVLIGFRNIGMHVLAPDVTCEEWNTMEWEIPQPGGRITTTSY